MIPDQFANFFVASAGAGAALIGLLFVAISIRPENTLGDRAHPLRKGVASGAFTALTNAFFVSMFALIPQSNLGVVALFVGLIDVLVTVRLGRGLRRGPRRAREEEPSWGAWWRMVVTLVLTAGIYAYEAMMGATLLRQPHDSGAVVGLCYVMILVYAIGLGRAWELLGGPGGGISTWLNPLRRLDDTTPAAIPATTESAATPPPAVPEPVASPASVRTEQQADKPHATT